MRARPWRGTIIFAGAAVAVAAVTVVRYTAPSSDTPTSSAAVEGTHTVVGDAERVTYGTVQVSVTFTGDTITDVTTLQAPHAHARSIAINARATPLLAREAVTAGSARIDTVSGATYTSEGYRRSLQSALDQVD